LAGGEEWAFKTIYGHYRNKIFTLAFKLTRSESAALDVVQEVFIKVWMNREQLATVMNFNSYLNTVTRNHLSNAFRRLAIEKTYLSQLISDEPFSLSQLQIDPALRAEIRTLYKQALQKLSPQQRRVYLLGKQEGLKYQEIASQLHISRDTVKEYMSQAKKTIAQHFRAHEYELMLLGSSFLAI
jgi:RNA polymerase sigma-70 factor (ECF subfamily)